MEKRLLGRTGHASSVVILGTAAFWNIDHAGAIAALDLVLARGVNHIDVAPQYGNAQAVLGPWLESRRDQFFLGCKTLMRQADAAWEDLQNSLRLLRTDRIDLHQLHSIGTLEELDQVFAPGGAMETLVRAREEGLVRWLGITGHGMLTPAVHIAALERFDFDTVMFPINPRLYADAHYRRDAERLLRIARERQVGVMIIKSLARAPWGERDKLYTPWYEPYDTSPDIEQTVRFALSLPVTAILSAAEVLLLPLIMQAAEQFSPMDETGQAALIAQHSGNEVIFDGPHPLSK